MSPNRERRSVGEVRRIGRRAAGIGRAVVVLAALAVGLSSGPPPALAAEDGEDAVAVTTTADERARSPAADGHQTTTPGAAPAEERSKGFSLPGSGASGPIHIDANVLEFDARADVATFRGEVVTTQDDVVMRSAVLRVTFTPSEGTVGNLDGLQTVVAEGDVHITQGDRIARGERAEFDDTARTLVLSGGAVLLEGSNEVRGERVIVYLDEERSVVEGTNSRVKAVLVPNGDGGTAAPGAGDGRQRRQRRTERTVAREVPTSGDGGPAE